MHKLIGAKEQGIGLERLVKSFPACSDGLAGEGKLKKVGGRAMTSVLRWKRENFFQGGQAHMAFPAMVTAS